MSERVELNPPWPWASQFRIAQGVRVGNTVYVSGQVAFDPQGNLVGGDDMERAITTSFCQYSKRFSLKPVQLWKT